MDSTEDSQVANQGAASKLAQGQPISGPVGTIPETRFDHGTAASTATVRVPGETPRVLVPGHEILGELGRGGMGVVYRARHVGLNRIVALKMILSGSHAGPQELARFKVEAEAIARLQHPNIVQIHDIGEHDGLPFFALEFCPGGSLARKLDGKPLPAKEAAQLVETLAGAMAVAHQASIIHRDLKPGNVLLTADGTPKIADFGLAKKLDEAGMTGSGAIMGTPSYMAPEQASGQASGAAGSLGPGVDIYALGAILYEVCTGRPPFHSPDPLQTLMMVTSMEPVPPQSLQPKLPRDLQTICLKCLEKSPKKRYATAQALADDLRRFLDGQPIAARPSGSFERLVKWSRRRPAQATLAVAAALAIAGLTAWFLQVQAAKKDLEVAVGETKASLAIALAAVDRNLVRISEQLAPLPQTEQIRRESLEEARELYERVLRIRPRDQGGKNNVADVAGRLGKVYQDLGRLDDAEHAYRQAQAIFLELKGLDATMPDYGRALAGLCNNLANIQRARNDLPAAEALLRQGFAEIEPLLKQAADEPESLKIAGMLHNTLGLILRSRQEFDAAAQEHGKALAMRQRLLELQPNNRDAQADAAASHSNLGTILLIRKRTEEAIIEFQAAAELLAEQTAPQQRFYRGQIQGNLAVAYEQLEKTPAALEAHAQALATLKGLVNDFPSVPGYRHIYAKEHLNVGHYLGQCNRVVEAEKHLKTSHPLLEGLTKEFPDNRAYRADLEMCHHCLTLAAEDLRDLATKKTPGK